MSKQLAQTIANRLQAGALVVIVQEADEQLAVEAAKAGAASCGQIVAMSGANPEAAERLEQLPTQSGVLLLSDFLAIYGTNALTVRLVREVALQQRDDGVRYSRLVLVETPETQIPASLLGDVEVVRPTLPDQEALAEELDLFIEAQEISLEGNGQTRYSIAGSVTGLPRHEANRLYARCYVENDGLDPAWLRKEKARKVSDSLAGALTFEKVSSADVGGLGNLKEWLGLREAAFASARAKAFGLPEPKGLMVVGHPGCGKSLLAKSVARNWKLPLLRLDIGKVMGRYVGQSEGQIRAAIEAAEACAPCVLWVDEIEKGLAGSSGGGGDSGTGQRVFGTLLTWLQEKEKPVFVVATANKIADLPPELLRKGRFDEIFFVGLPNLSERIEIIGIHLARKDRKFTTQGVKKIAGETDGFSGAELEEAVIAGLFAAYADGERDLKVTDVLAAASATTPLSKTAATETEALKKWAEGRARFASAPTSDTKGAPRRRGPQLKKA